MVVRFTKFYRALPNSALLIDGIIRDASVCQPKLGFVPKNAIRTLPPICNLQNSAFNFFRGRRGKRELRVLSPGDLPIWQKRSTIYLFGQSRQGSIVCQYECRKLRANFCMPFIHPGWGSRSSIESNLQYPDSSVPFRVVPAEAEALLLVQDGKNARHREAESARLSPTHRPLEMRKAPRIRDQDGKFSCAS